MKTADRVDVPPSGIREFFELVQGRDDVISLGVGEPDFVTPWGIREACIYSLERGQTSYTSNRGQPGLRSLISDSVQERLGERYDPESEVLVTTGVSEALDLAVRALVDPGDEVVVLDPSYVSYGPNVEFSGGSAVRVETRAEDGFRPDPEDLEAACSDDTVALMLNYPNNPTGAALDRESAEAIAGVAERNDLAVVSDEVYSFLNYGREHVSVAALDGMRRRTVVLDGFSKYFAMTGWRLGYACGPEELVGAMNRIHQYTMLCAPITAQNAAEEALSNGWGEAERMRKEYGRRRRLTVKGLEEAGLSCVEPRGAFYAFPDVSSTGLTGREFAERLLEEESVAVVPGSAFGEAGESHVRLSYAASREDLKEALDRIGALVSRL